VDAIVTAGGIPTEGDPLYAYTQGKSKSLIDVGGRPMIQWVLDALAGADRIGRVVVVGLDAASGVRCGDKPLGFAPNRGDMVSNIEAGVRWLVSQDPGADKILLASSDIPLITAEMVNWAIDAAEATEHDLYYSVVEKAVMERRFPGSKRSYIYTKGAVVCGADLNVLRAEAVLDNRARSLWGSVVEARKNAFKQAQLVGFDILLLLLTRQLNLDWAERALSKRLGIRGRLLRCPYAEVGMDVDKPAQLEMVKRDIEQHRRAAGSVPATPPLGQLELN
jgi:GTP:adenosylcobinamide-phosphate guanylyltransferase